MDIEEEKQLVNDFLETRSESLFKRLYKLYATDLYRLAMQLNNGDREASEDISQEAWIRAILNLREFKWQSSLKTWLSGIVINCNRESKRKKTHGDIPEKQIEILREHSQNLDQKMDVKKALETLPKGYKEVLVLHDFEGYKHFEISAILGITEGTSKSQLFNARRAMQKLIN